MDREFTECSDVFRKLAAGYTVIRIVLHKQFEGLVGSVVITI